MKNWFRVREFIRTKSEGYETSGVSDGINLPCSICRKFSDFDYLVDDEFWKEIVPSEMRLGVICLSCLDKLACSVGKRIADHIGRISFSGCKDTIDFVPTNVFLNVKNKRENNKNSVVTPREDLINICKEACKIAENKMKERKYNE